MDPPSLDRLITSFKGSLVATNSMKWLDPARARLNALLTCRRGLDMIEVMAVENPSRTLELMNEFLEKWQNGEDLPSSSTVQSTSDQSVEGD